MATISFDVPDDDIRTLKDGWSHVLPEYDKDAEGANGVTWRVRGAALAAVLRFELPWEPSEQDVTDYCEARDWGTSVPANRDAAAVNLKDARARGWDAVPRRLGGADGT